MVENETCLKVKRLRSDNGDEYVSGEFKRHCVNSEIVTVKNIPRTPQ